MKPLFHKLLLAACALHLSGAHWALLQVTAWTGMLVERSQTSGVVAAVVTTFDGEHPCALCTAITAGQTEEKQKQNEAPAFQFRHLYGLQPFRGSHPAVMRERVAAQDWVFTPAFRPLDWVWKDWKNVLSRGAELLTGYRWGERKKYKLLKR